MLCRSIYQHANAEEHEEMLAQMQMQIGLPLPLLLSPACYLYGNFLIYVSASGHALQYVSWK